MIIGAPLGRNFSAIEAADALVQQWEQIYEENRQQHDEEALAGILEQLEQARADRAVLGRIGQRASVEESLENTQMFRSKAVAERIDILQQALERSECEGERVNIQGAIRCYQNESIVPSDYFALIYAGHFVDIAPSYASFTYDRAERLDRYFAEHGPGWLWFEPPLNRDSSVLGGGGINAMKSTWVAETESPFGMGEYHVTVGFKRVDDFNCRKAKEEKGADTTGRAAVLQCVTKASRKSKSKPAAKMPNNKTQSAGTAKTSLDIFQLKPAAPAAPSEEPSSIKSDAVRLYFHMLLDTGATLPMLYREDFAALGINPKTYAAASAIQISTANGAGQTCVYELHVSVCDTRTCRSLVDEDKPVWPDAHPSLGGILPVAQAIGSSNNQAGVAYGTSMDDRLIDITNKAEGKNTLRLSGLLPFKTCYVQSTPGLGTIWLGEDRRDVLGAQRMPGQMRWEAGSTEMFDPGHPRMDWQTLQSHNDGNPSLVRMAHEVIDTKGERVVRLTDVEEEGWHGRSRTLILGKDGKLPVCEIEPRQQKKRKVVEGS
ncbi:hypothetical protein ACHAQA_004479 [Verticillium albo-atrum]